MKIFNIIISCIVFVGSLVGYWIGNISTLNSEVAINVSPTQMPNVFTPSGDNQTPVGRGDCYIPLPAKKKYAGKGFMDFKMESGTPIKVLVTGYKPTEDYFFTMKPSIIAQERGRGGVFLQLESISEFKANGKVFGYIVETRYPKSSDNHPDSNNGLNAHTMEGHYGLFRCYDLNGDGKFEYPNDDGTQRPKVPDWVIQ